MKTRWRWWAVAAVSVLALGEAAADPGRGPEGAASRAERRRWALGKMDEMANEARRCAERFRDRRQVEECRAEFTRRYREYNEAYLEAGRE